MTRRRLAVFAILLFIGIGAVTVCLDQAAMAIARTLDACGEGVNASRKVEQVLFDGKPPEVLAGAVEDPVPNLQTGINVLGDVPAYDWSYGCSATSAAMLFGFYDRNDYTNMYTGGTNDGIAPLTNAVWGHTTYPSVTCGECPLSATHQGVDGRAVKGHVDDYWVDYGDAGPDPFIGNWTEHTRGDCTGDYMGTSQSNWQCTDGATYFFWYTNGDPLYDYIGQEPNYRDGCHGMRLFAESRGYTVVTNFTQLIQGQGTDPAKGFTFAQYCTEIDAGRPVLIHVTGHTMLGYGYDSTGNVVYLKDTWDYSSHTMTWGSTYSGMQHKSVSVIRLGSTVSVTVQTLGLVSSYPATVHYTQEGVPKTAATYSTWSDNVDRDTTVTIDSTVTVSTTERYGTSAATSWTAAEVATYSVPYYHQFKPLVSAATAGAGHTDLDSTNFATLTYYRFGSQGVFEVFDSQNYYDWVDTGSTLTLSGLSSDSTALHRWYSSEAASWTVNDAGGHSAIYWDQFNPTVSVATAGLGHVDLDAANCVTLSYYQYGAITAFDVFDGQSLNTWMDTGSAVSLSNPSSGSTQAHRWYCSGSTSWAVSDGDLHLATYWEQFKPSISVVTAGDGHTDLDVGNCATLTYQQFGSALTSDVFDARIFDDWVDIGSTVSLSSTSSASTATQRWCAVGVTTWVVNDASTNVVTYWEQFKPTVSVVTAGTGHADLNTTNYVTLSYYAFGAAGTAYVFDAQAFDGWVDRGTMAILSNPSSASTATHRWHTPDTTSWTVSDAAARSATYWEQYKPAIKIEGLSPSHPSQIQFTVAGKSMDASASDTWSGWVDVGSVVTTDKSIEGGWVGDWHAGDEHEQTADSAFSVTVDYARSYTGIYILVGLLLLLAAAVGTGLFFLLRRRKKAA